LLLFSPLPWLPLVEEEDDVEAMVEKLALLSRLSLTLLCLGLDFLAMMDV